MGRKNGGKNCGDINQKNKPLKDFNVVEKITLDTYNFQLYTNN